jgi:hypothetical protein
VTKKGEEVIRYRWRVHLKPIEVEAETEDDALFEAMARAGFDFHVEKVEYER